MKNLLFILIFMGSLNWVTAQEIQKNSSTQSEKNKNFERWSNELELSNEQKSQILEIKSKYSAEITKSRQSGMDREAQKKLWLEQENEIERILTAQQLEKANALKQKYKERNSKKVSNSTNK